MNAVFLGATRGIGRALARRICARGDRLFLLGRNSDELAASARDLAVEAGREPPGIAHCDLLDPAGFAAAFDAAERALGGCDAAILSAGEFARQEELEADPQLCRRLLEADFVGSVLWCEEARRRLLARGGGTLCAFSSVAGDRGRKPVVLYGAAKAGLSAYLEGLDHRYHASGLRVVCVKPGFVRTGMTAGLPAPPFAGEPDAVALRVLRAIDRGTPVVYAPAVWRWILLAVRSLPRAVMRRAEF